MDEATTVGDLEEVLAEALHGRPFYVHEAGSAHNRCLVVNGMVSVTELAEAIVRAGYTKGGTNRGDAA